MTKPDIDPILAQSLSVGIAELKLDIPSQQQEMLLRYIALLHHWNRAFNLTAVRGLAEMVPRHLLDSLVVSPYLHGKSILDVGSGPGLPGIPLAIINPHNHFILLDSKGKKARFMRQAVLELGLENVRVEQVRIENFQDLEGFDCITTRAFASLPDIVRLTHRLLRPGGRLLAMKGSQAQEELAATDLEGVEVETIPLQVPQLEGERYLLAMRLVCPYAHLM